MYLIKSDDEIRRKVYHNFLAMDNAKISRN